ncbi:MAG: hypothetical protein QOF33_1093 [Thermomicrobiales bacterium]|jgi:hypothetical protein|nr:hypothetical protein [Thermomicrobiales bacterium]
MLEVDVAPFCRSLLETSSPQLPFQRPLFGGTPRLRPYMPWARRNGSMIRSKVGWTMSKIGFG